MLFSQWWRGNDALWDTVLLTVVETITEEKYNFPKLSSTRSELNEGGE